MEERSSRLPCMPVLYPASPSSRLYAPLFYVVASDNETRKAKDNPPVLKGDTSTRLSDNVILFSAPLGSRRAVIAGTVSQKLQPYPRGESTEAADLAEASRCATARLGLSNLSIKKAGTMKCELFALAPCYLRGR
ncbi:conserved hypothetical protein [Coccidioides posadasii str. Silveira]|uniref:Uncharacterized protein n=2 Tax=Coccidioides posadasii TaxID=199306 RepID=E9D043_COCPS|nr:conserved hypothetical protein [Coccidioides posadasii str. Silveira]KMM73141.1 hypothetical protein CPAG_09430 [Coccidioides posadasii RMSCC 3488]